jgi:hypothetical protein
VTKPIVVTVGNSAIKLVQDIARNGAAIDVKVLESYSHDDWEFDRALELAQDLGVTVKGITQHHRLVQGRFETGEVHPIFALIMFFIVAIGLILLPIASVLGGIIMRLAGL